ncbi:LPS export ABC transporter periplasmic protein LptC [Hwangdonia lutea]|uniref:LPS export ABC transporter periplasmic protein LptC n=1 Tax=Hwangdonia lutea TaxID=3075823 RepID=A0AA97EN41_9FLAO|nr:LPS export ABC transporter periplasmic protein LptC [Hwangdonia sp. SCSIO 19198]WOD44397.1 LPS export ABC transporter periplasmic protein LptC [Hwangdonia sp. SCSIO 19198]
MKKTYKYYILNIVTAIVVTMFFSCKDNFKAVQKMGISENEPIGIAENINLVHTDSGKVKAILLSPKMLNYQNRDFPFFEFPNGITLDLLDDDNNKNVVVADYAINYSETKLIDLQGNVKITTSTNDTLYAEQLFYDQEKEWLFTNKPVTFITGLDVINGNGFDSNKNFTNAVVLEVTGTITLDE